MKFFSFDETTYPGIPDEIGPEVRQTNRFCDFLVGDHQDIPEVVRV